MSAPPRRPLRALPRPANDTAPDVAGGVPAELLPFVEALADLCFERVARRRGIGSPRP